MNILNFKEEAELDAFFSRMDKVVIFGVGGMGKNLYIYLKEHGLGAKLAFFAATRKEADEFWGRPVKEVSELDEAERSLPVVIATRKNYHDSIFRVLGAAGVEDIHTLSEELLNRVEYLANQSFHFDFGPCTQRYEAWQARKERIRKILEAEQRCAAGGEG